MLKQLLKWWHSLNWQNAPNENTVKLHPMPLSPAARILDDQILSVKAAKQLEKLLAKLSPYAEEIRREIESQRVANIWWVDDLRTKLSTYEIDGYKFLMVRMKSLAGSCKPLIYTKFVPFSKHADLEQAIQELTQQVY